MEFIVEFAENFMGIFDLGAQTFIGNLTGIVPKVMMIMILMNAIQAFMGQERMNKLASLCSKNIITRQLILPFISAFMLSTPMCLTTAIYLPEFYKPAYYDSVCFCCHTNNGLFPHVNPGELFVFLGIATGIETLGLSVVDLALRYFLVGLVMNFFCGVVTEKVTGYLCKSSGIKLSKKVGVSNAEYARMENNK